MQRKLGVSSGGKLPSTLFGFSVSVQSAVSSSNAATKFQFGNDPSPGSQTKADLQGCSSFFLSLKSQAMASSAVLFFFVQVGFECSPSVRQNSSSESLKSLISAGSRCHGMNSPVFWTS